LDENMKGEGTFEEGEKNTQAHDRHEGKHQAGSRM